MKRLYIFLFFICMNFTALMGQSSLFSTEYIKPVSSIPNIAFFNPGQEIKLEEFAQWLEKKYNLSKGLSFRLLSTEHDMMGMIHYRFRQTFFGLDIEGTMQIVHTRNGWVTGFNGLAFNYFNLSIKPTLSREKARVEAIKWFGSEPKAEEFVYQLPAERIMDSLWKGELIFAPSEHKYEQPYYKLSWQFDFYSPNGPKREHIYVDAKAGDVIFHLPLLHSADSACTAKTAYRGTRNITTFYDPVKNKFVSHERSKFIEMQNQSSIDTPNSVFFNYFNTTNHWAPTGIDSTVTDCYWAMEQTDAMYKNWFGRNGYNGMGAQYLAYTNPGWSGNAYWYGSVAQFGTGFTSLDIVGHEFTHGVTFSGPRLSYDQEPGALNEALSDIFGKVLEWYADSASGKFSWVICKDVFVTGGWRDMKNTPLRYYKGKYWQAIPYDNGGVHTNSQVLDYFFYLITEGDTGTNQVGYKFNIDSLGFYKASQIMYRLSMAYLTQTSDYPDMANCIVLAASDLYGNCSNEVRTITEALRVIGLTPVTLFTPGTSKAYQLTTATAINTKMVRILKLIVRGNCNSALIDSLQSIKISLNGTTTSLSTLSNLKVFYTGDKNVFDSTNMILNQGPLTTNIILNRNLKLNKTSNIFWITIDVKSTARYLEFIDISIDSLKMNNKWQVPLDHNPPERVVILGCKPALTYTLCYFPKISMIQFAGTTVLDSSCNISDSSYRFMDPGFFVNPGQSYFLKLRSYNPYLRTTPNTQDTNFTFVWLDLNRNGNFEASELVLKGKLPNPNFGATISIPSSQAYGRVLMRMATAVDSSNGVNPCGWYFGVTYCDVIINIGKPISTIIPSTNCVGKPTRFTAVLDSNITYHWYLNKTQLLQSGKGSPWNILTYIPFSAGIYTIKLRTSVSTSDYTESVSAPQVVYDSIPVPLLNPPVINLCVGNGTTLFTDSVFVSPAANNLQITYDPAIGKSGLQTANKVYMYAGLVDTPGGQWKYTIGNWGKDDAIGQMTKVGFVYWQINFNPLNYFKPNKINELKYIAIIFRNEDGTAFGLDSGGSIIYIRIDSLYPKSSFNGVSAYYIKNYLWSKNGVPLSGNNRASLNVASSGIYKVSVNGGLCSYVSPPVTVIVDSFPIAGSIIPKNSRVCKGSPINLRVINYRGSQVSWESANATGLGWTNTGINNDSINTIATQAGWYKAIITNGACGSVQTDSVFVDIDSPVVTGIVTVNKNSICAGAAVLLTLNGSFGNIRWQQFKNGSWSYMNGTHDTLTTYPQDSIYFRAELGNGNCAKQYTDSVFVKVYQRVIKGNITADKNTVCSGQAALLTLKDYYGNIEWQQKINGNWQLINGSEDTINVYPTEDSYYRASLSNGVCANRYADSILISINKIKIDSLIANPKSICGDDSSYIQAFSNSTGVFKWYKNSQLINGANQKGLWIKDSATYSLQFTDTMNCSVNSSIKLMMYSKPAPVIFKRTGHLLYLDSVLYLGTTINWYIDGSLQSTHNFSLPISGSHTYTVSIADNHGCQRISNSYTVDLTGINDPILPWIRIYPNPSSGIYSISSDFTGAIPVIITDMTGRVILSKEIDNGLVDISKEPAGVYLMYVEMKGVKMSYRLMKY